VAEALQNAYVYSVCYGYNMYKNQSGFSAVAIVLVIVVLSVLGFAGWRVYDNNKPAKSKLVENTISTLEHTDTATTITFKYPSNWTISKYVYEPCCEGEPKPEPDWTKVPQPINLKPNGAHRDIVVSITVDNTGQKTIDKVWSERTIDQFNTYEKKSINGYDALYQKTDFVGPSEVEAYIDHRFLLVSGKDSVEVYFREKYRHNWNNEESGGKTNFNGMNYWNDFESIVNSINFLN